MTSIEKSEGRTLTLVLEPASGIINLFYAFVNGKKVIAATGDSKREWTGEIPDGEVRFKTRVTGIDDSGYKLTIDLPGNANDQKLKFNLEGGYHEFEMYL